MYSQTHAYCEIDVTLSLKLSLDDAYAQLAYSQMLHFCNVDLNTPPTTIQDILTTLATISDFMRDVVCGILSRDTEALMLRYLHKTRKVCAQ